MDILQQIKQPKKIGKWCRKMTDEACLFAMRAYACDGKPTGVATLVKEKFGIEISPIRIRKMADTGRWQQHFSNYRDEYLAKCKSTTGIYIADKNNRLEIAQKLLEECLNGDIYAHKKDKIKDALEILKYAKDESKNSNSPEKIQNGGIMQFIHTQNVSNDTTCGGIDGGNGTIEAIQIK